MNEEWTSINIADFVQLSNGPDEKSDIDIRLVVSPYDIPIATRGYEEESGTTFKIEFMYIQDEDVEYKTVEQGIKIGLGKKSKRIREVILPEQFKGKLIGLTLIISAIEKLKEASVERKKNYEVTKRLINREKSLFHLTQP